MGCRGATRGYVFLTEHFDCQGDPARGLAAGYEDLNDHDHLRTGMLALARMMPRHAGASIPSVRCVPDYST